jgi:hypothetical protein
MPFFTRTAQVLLTLLLLFSLVHFGLKPGFGSFLIATGSFFLWAGGLFTLWLFGKLRQGGKALGAFLEKIATQGAPLPDALGDAFPRNSDGSHRLAAAPEFLKVDADWCAALPQGVDSLVERFTQGEKPRDRLLIHGLRLTRRAARAAIGIQNVLESRLSPSELTFDRYLGTVESASAGILLKLKEAHHRLMIIPAEGQGAHHDRLLRDTVGLFEEIESGVQALERLHSACFALGRPTLDAHTTPLPDLKRRLAPPAPLPIILKEMATLEERIPLYRSQNL